MKTARFLLLGIAFSCASTMHAMVYDNRFLPLIIHPYITVECRPSHLQLDFFATTANRSINENGDDIGLPEVWGLYNQSELAQSIIAVGKPNLLPPNWLAAPLPWVQTGKIQSQGGSLFIEQHLFEWFSLGASMAAMRVESSQQFSFSPRTTTAILGPGDLLELDEIRRQMNEELHLACNHWSHNGFGDIDAFIRASCAWYYEYKLRSIIAGARIGVLIPTGVTRDIDNPASIPFGGNGHWGMYGAFDAEFEVKEDWKLGLLGRLSKRFAKTSIQRMPAGLEPETYGAIVGPARVNPGLTGIFSGYFTVENLREGFGLRLQYTLINHWKDSWKDERADQSVPSRLCDVETRSGWASEYISLTALYDFDKMHRQRCDLPIVNLTWDIPVALLVAHRSVQSFKVSLGVEFNW